MASDSVVLRELRITNFRGFRGQRTLHLGRITLLLGRNGLGKTTVFDAIDWALFDRASRLGGEEPAVRSNLWDPHSPEVSLEGDGFSLTRTEHGAKLNGRAYDPSVLAVDPTVFGDSRSLVAALRGLAYLSQDTIREIATAPPEGRATMLRALTGVPLAESALTGIRKVRLKLEESSKQDSGAIKEARLRQEEVAVDIRRLEQIRFAQEEPARRSVVAFLGKRAMSAPLEQLAGSLSEMEQQLVKRVAATAGAVAMARALRDRVVSHTTRLNHFRSRLTDASVTFSTLVTSVSAMEHQVEGANAEWLALHEDHGRALDLARRAVEEKSVAESAHRKAAEARSLVAQHVSATAQLTQAAAKTLEARSRAEQTGRALEEARASAIAAANTFDSIQQSVHLFFTLVESREAFASAEERARLSRVQLEQVRHDIQSRASGVEELRSAVVSERARVRASGNTSERVAALLQELVSLQQSQDSQCLLCGHDHESPGGLRTSIDASIRRALASQGDHARLQRLERDLLTACDGLTNLQDELERRNAHAIAADGALDAARRHLASNEAAYGDLQQPQVSDLTAARERVAQLRGQVATIDAETRLAAGAVESALAEAASLEGLVRSLEKRIRSVSAATDSEPNLEEEVARATSIADAATKQAHKSSTAQQRAEALRDVAIADLSRALKDRDLALVEVDTLTSSIADMTVEASSLVAAVQAMGIDCTALEHVLSRFDAHIALQEGEADQSRQRADSCAELRRRVTSLLETTALPVLATEMSGLSRTISNSEAHLVGLRKAEERLATLNAQIEHRIQSAAESQLDLSGETVNEVLALLTPHRHLNVVNILRDGSLNVTEDALPKGVDPSPYSSTGQLTCLALSLFLGISVLQKWSRIGLVMLDEPIQHLDDVKFLNFIELLKRVAKERQIVVSTADRNIGQLLKLKLSRWASSQSEELVIHDFVDFDREKGPVFASDSKAEHAIAAG